MIFDVIYSLIFDQQNAGAEQRHHLKYKLLRNSRETVIFTASAPAHCYDCFPYESKFCDFLYFFQDFSNSLNPLSSNIFIFIRANSIDRIEIGGGLLSWYSWQFGHQFFAGLISFFFQIFSRILVISEQKSTYSSQVMSGYHFCSNSDNISGNQALWASPAGIIFFLFSEIIMSAGEQRPKLIPSLHGH